MRLQPKTVLYACLALRIAGIWSRRVKRLQCADGARLGEQLKWDSKRAFLFGFGTPVMRQGGHTPTCASSPSSWRTMAPFFGGMPLVQSTRHGLGDPTVARWSRKAPPPTDIGLCDPRHSVSRERGIPLRDCPRHELHIFKRVTYFQEGL